MINVAVYNSTHFQLTLYPHSVDGKLSCKKLKTQIEKDFSDTCFHLQIFTLEYLRVLTITDTNVHKESRTISDPASVHSL